MSPKVDRYAVAAAAQELALCGEHDQAIKTYGKIVEENPRDVGIWIRIGDLHAKKGAHSEAANIYQKVAEFYSEQGFYLKALALYQRALMMGGSEVALHVRMAEVSKQLGLLRDAIRHYQLVAERYQEGGDTKAARATVQQILDLDPEHVASRAKLAELGAMGGVVQAAPAGLRYYLRRRGKVHGPFLERAIALMLKHHKLDGDEEIAVDGRSWQPLAAVPALLIHSAHAAGPDPASRADERDVGVRAGARVEDAEQETRAEASCGALAPTRPLFKISVRCTRPTAAEIHLRMERRALGALVDQELISPAQRALIEERARVSGTSCLSEVVRQGILEGPLLDTLSRAARVPSVNLDEFDLEPEIISLIPRTVAVAASLVPVGRAGRSLIIAMANPLDIAAIEEVAFLTDYCIETVVATPLAIQNAIRRYYPAVN